MHENINAAMHVEFFCAAYHILGFQQLAAQTF